MPLDFVCLRSSHDNVIWRCYIEDMELDHVALKVCADRELDTSYHSSHIPFKANQMYQSSFNILYRKSHANESVEGHNIGIYFVIDHDSLYLESLY